MSFNDAFADERAPMGTNMKEKKNIYGRAIMLMIRQIKTGTKIPEAQI